MALGQIGRSLYVECEILKWVLQFSNHQGYSTSLPQLGTFFREAKQPVSDTEMVDAIKRQYPSFLTLWKWSDAHGRFITYPAEISDDGEFFYRAGFQLRRTPHTQPQIEKLETMIQQSESSRKTTFEFFERLGAEQVRADLAQTGGLRVVGMQNAPLGWEWLQMKDAQKTAAAEKPRGVSGLTLIADSRLDELRNLTSASFDLRKLVRLCEELNIAFGQECYLATAMLTRGLLDHVPPLFGHASFKEVANNYGGGGKSFKETMHHLENAARKIADAHLHMPIRNSETLPTAQQVSCGQQLDALLAEIVRITK